MRGNFFAFTLLDARGEAQYVGVGREGHWTKLWQLRHIARDSELGRWLLTLDAQPTAHRLLSYPVPMRAAMAFAAGERKRLIGIGHRLLSGKAQDRAIGTYAPGGSKRRVRSPKGEAFESVRAAAHANGVTSTTIVLWCKSCRDGWRYDDANVSRFSVPEKFELLQ
jgi:hypothetical protein